MKSTAAKQVLSSVIVSHPNHGLFVFGIIFADPPHIPVTFGLEYHRIYILLTARKNEYKIKHDLSGSAAKMPLFFCGTTFDYIVRIESE